MPISRGRKKEQYVPKSVAAAKPLPTESPRWLAPAMVMSFLIGLIWIVIFYVDTDFPIPGIGSWNIVVGFVFITFGFGLATKWR